MFLIATLVVPAHATPLKQFAEALSAWSFILMNAIAPSAQADARRRSARTAGVSKEWHGLGRVLPLLKTYSKLTVIEPTRFIY